MKNTTIHYFAKNSRGHNTTSYRQCKRKLLFPKSLPMPAKVIATVHQFTLACKKYKGSLFTEYDGNIINDDNEHDN